MPIKLRKGGAMVEQGMKGMMATKLRKRVLQPHLERV